MEEPGRPKRDSADDLLRRALVDQEATVSVALKVRNLPLSEAVTVIFHGRRDLGTSRPTSPPATMAPAPRSAPIRCCGCRATSTSPRPTTAPTPSASTPSRRPRCATRWSAPTRCSTSGASRSSQLTAAPITIDRSIELDVRCPPTGCCPPRSWRPTATSSSRRCAPRARWPRVVRRSASPAPSRTSPASTRCPTTPSAACRTSSTPRPTTPARWPSSSRTRKRRPSGSWS